MPSTPSRRPIGRPPSALTTPVVGWKARRDYRRFCAAPWDAPPVTAGPVPKRGTPATRARTPQLSQARTHHNSSAPDTLHDRGTTLYRTTEYGLMWQCGVCTSWTRDPARGYSRCCNVCKLARPPRVVIVRQPDIEAIRRHAAQVHALAGQLRSRRYAMLCNGPVIRSKRDNCIRTSEMFLQLAQERDAAELQALADAYQKPQSRWLTQVFVNGERYLGLSRTDYVSTKVWPGLLDGLPSTAAVADAARGVIDRTSVEHGRSGRHAGQAPAEGKAHGTGSWEKAWQRAERASERCGIARVGGPVDARGGLGDEGAGHTDQERDALRALHHQPWARRAVAPVHADDPAGAWAAALFGLDRADAS